MSGKEVKEPAPAFFFTAGNLVSQQAHADSTRPSFIIASAFGALACIVCLFIGDLTKVMNYRVDAPIEKLHANHHHHNDDDDDDNAESSHA